VRSRKHGPLSEFLHRGQQVIAKQAFAAEFREPLTDGMLITSNLREQNRIRCLHIGLGQNAASKGHHGHPGAIARHILTGGEAGAK
jgi:hypothetical protein